MACSGWSAQRKAIDFSDMDGFFDIGWQALLQEAVARVFAPFLAFFFPTNMYYWPYLISAVLIAVAVYVLARPLRDFSLPTMIKAAFNPHIWFAKSARADYRFYVVNGILYPLLTAPIALSGLALGMAMAGGLASLFGPMDEAAMGTVAIRVAYSIAYFVCLDFGRFLAHYSLHQIPLLWEFHKVHHSAEVLTPITSGRLHPVDLFVMGTGQSLGIALATGIFFYLGAGEVGLFTVLGLHVGLIVYNAIGNLRHSHVWLSYGPLNYVFISPAQHQIHHSKLAHHFDKNCGFGLAIWDWMFGTLYVPKGRETFPMGLGDGTDGTWHTVRSMYLRPFANAASLIKRSGSRPADPSGSGVAD
jgi:sterol desaturase/sphingolipid hydroxylase (fatty acid hydroxylase superfamily)